MSVESQVMQFHVAFGHPFGGPPGIASPERMALRRSLIDEEVEELYEACEEHDIVGIADALADLVYVAVGMAIELGIPFGRVFNEVHRSNMEKSSECGHCFGRGYDVDDMQHDVRGERCETCAGNGRFVVRRSDGKILKPEGWTPPNVKGIIEKVTKVYS